MQGLDHVEESKVTWAEFMNWLAKEGIIRDIANDHRLFPFTLTRLQECETYQMKQHLVRHMLPIEVAEFEKGRKECYYLIVYDSREVELVREENIEEQVMPFWFESKYKKPKKLKDYPLNK